MKNAKKHLRAYGVIAIAIIASALILEMSGVLGTSQALACPTGWNC
ncbi:hypothetical protein SAMN06265374_0144 [Roseibium denhamense]|uniref:Heme A synthase n=1 Tax=Roseibium denhamense TaxID=76305 RepID=A0ABY1PMK4_9HYPH|nr:hypothetical protein SAMN06265374_0144 [Roseibium denhamense]